MAKFRYHFSTREFYHVDIEADNLEKAIEELQYCGVHHQNEEKGHFLFLNCVDCDDEYMENNEQWEIIGEDAE